MRLCTETTLSVHQYNRIEIISPGHLPNNLTTDKIKTGNANLRNPILASFVAKGLLPYHGLGTGIRRALDAWPDIEFRDDREGNLFTAVVQRHTSDARLSTNGSEEPTKNSEISSEKSSEKSGKSSEIIPSPSPETSEKLLSTAEKILTLLRAHPELSARQMAETLKISSRTVEKHLADLRQKGKLRRVGPAKGGHWELPGQNDPEA